MLEQTSDEKKLELARTRQALSVTLADEAPGSVVLQLPDADDLNKIRNMYFQKMSAKEVSDEFRDNWGLIFNNERERLLKKREVYGGSPTFLSHLATLSEFSGNIEECVNSLRAGMTVDHSSYFRDRLGRMLTGVGDYSNAESVLQNADLRADADANLGLAFIRVLNGEFHRASELVRSSLAIDSTNWQALLLAGALELHHRNADHAIRFFRAAAEDRGSSSAPHLLLAAAYCESGRTDKAIKALRRAVAMNPADENSVIFYANALMSENRFEEASRVLTEFTLYEQKSAAAWDRLARSFYEMGLNQRALEALQHQASVFEGPQVWNNMGLVFWRMGDGDRTTKYLSKAIEASIKEGFSSYLPFYNAFVYLGNRGKFAEALEISELIPAERIPILAQRRIASTILALRCEALANVGKTSQAVSEFDRLFALPAKSGNLYRALLLSATNFYTVVNKNTEKALEYAKLALAEARKEGADGRLLEPLLNNVVFVLLEFGEIEEAEALMPMISSWVHKSPTATATLGLLHMKKGRLASGRALYEEAMTLAQNEELRQRLKQKMNLEIGKFLLAHGNRQRATRYLREAKSAPTALRAIELEATQLLHGLP